MAATEALKTTYTLSYFRIHPYGLLSKGIELLIDCENSSWNDAIVAAPMQNKQQATI